MNNRLHHRTDDHPGRGARRPRPGPAGVRTSPSSRKAAPKVFIDCNDCDMDYIRTEIPFVNYVRDRKEADVHVLITTQTTGSGGTEYCLSFIGLGPYAGTDNKLLCAVSTTDTEEEVRRGYVAVLKMGLIPYTARTPIRSLLSIGFQEKVKPTDVVDPWKFWVFSISAGGDVEKESQRSQTSLDFSLAASKVTPGPEAPVVGRTPRSTTRTTSTRERRSPDVGGTEALAVCSPRAWASIGRSASSSTSTRRPTRTSISASGRPRPSNTTSSPIRSPPGGSSGSSTASGRSSTATRKRRSSGR